MKLITTCLIAIAMCVSPLCAANRTEGNHRRHIIHVQYGIASWYGDRSQGHLMACGVPFNKYALVAAHRTLPLGTKVKVINLRNGRWVVLRIRDRGPWIAGRIIDVSKAAAKRLGFTERGLAPVEVRVLSLPKRRTRLKQAASG
jgi:rare lipoprotein A